jgi:hypothetical protein
MKTKLNRALIVDSNAIEEVIDQLTNVGWSLGLEEKLEAVKNGMTSQQLNDIDAKVFGRHMEIVYAAFQAGYMVGRNPDLLILAAAGGDSDENDE